MIERFEVWETIGIGRGPVGLELIFQAIDKKAEMKNKIELKSQIIAKADVSNANGRVYPKKVLEKVVDDFNNMTKDSMIGQMGMPHDSIIHFSMASHLVKDLRLSDENELVADIHVLDTPCGKQLSEMIENGDVAFRLQGIGQTKSVDGVDVIQDDYKVITINAVSAETAA